jgi:hypothetical protein
MILNPDIYQKAKEIADKTYKTHGAYKSGFLVKKYKELGGEYADDGKPRDLTRWFKEEWKDVAGLPYPVYRPTKRVSEKTPLTVNEISPESLTRNAFVKQIYENRRNLSPFEGEPYTVKRNPKPEYNYSAEYNGGYLGAGRMMGGDLGPTYPREEDLDEIYRQIRNLLIDNWIPSTSDWNRALHLLVDFESHWNITLGSERRELYIADDQTLGFGLLSIRKLIEDGPTTDYLDKDADFIPPIKLSDLMWRYFEVLQEDHEGAGRMSGSGFYRLPNGCTLYTGGALTTKRVSEFTQNVQDVFNLLSISRKYKIIGSGALQEIKYSADYDLNELFKDEISDKKSALDRLYKVFRDKFIDAKENQETWITDFKCGEDSNGEPLRWSYEDMMRGYKRMENGRLISFQDCLLMKSTLKLDIIALVDGRFVEFSDNYFIKLDKDANFFPHDMEKDHLLNSIKHDYSFQMFSAGNIFKALKRAFAYYKLEAEGKNESKLDRLLAFFNSETGLLYKLKSEMETIQSVLEQTFRKPKLEQIHYNLKLILEQLKGQPTLRSLIESTLKQRTPKAISQYLEKASDLLFDEINKSSLRFVSQNKNLLLV